MKFRKRKTSIPQRQRRRVVVKWPNAEVPCEQSSKTKKKTKKVILLSCFVLYVRWIPDAITGNTKCIKNIAVNFRFDDMPNSQSPTHSTKWKRNRLNQSTATQWARTKRSIEDPNKLFIIFKSTRSHHHHRNHFDLNAHWVLGMAERR